MTSTGRTGLSKKQLSAMSKWANKPRDDTKVDQTKRDLWEGVHRFIDERGGAIVSVRHAWPIRMECDPESELPERLRELGHDVGYVCQETRLGAPVSTRRVRFYNANTAYSFCTRVVYEIRLPPK